MRRENPDVWKKFGEHWTPEMYETLKSCDLWYSLGINSKTFLSQMWATSEEFSSFQTWQTWQHLKNSQQNEGLLWILKCSLTFHISWKKTNIQPGEPLGHQWCEKNSTTLRLRVNHLFGKKTQTWQNSAPDVPTFLNERCPFSTVAGRPCELNGRSMARDWEAGEKRWRKDQQVEGIIYYIHIIYICDIYRYIHMHT